VVAWNGSRSGFSAIATFAYQLNIFYYREIIEIAQGLSATVLACWNY
jgi:hypothetical protein